jgi:hypothetical protein
MRSVFLFTGYNMVRAWGYELKLCRFPGAWCHVCSLMMVDSRLGFFSSGIPCTWCFVSDALTREFPSWRKSSDSRKALILFKLSSVSRQQTAHQSNMT